MEIIKKAALLAWSDRHKILRYVISGVAAAIVNIFALYIATDIFGIWYLASSIIAFVGAICVSFSLQKFWTFEDGSVDKIHRQMLIYIVFAVCTTILNTVLVYAQVQFIGVHYVLAQIIAGAILAFINFLVYKKFIFVTA